MPSTNEVLQARAQVKEWAVEQLIKENHPVHSAQAIVARMSYEEQLEYAQKLQGPIYTGPYSPY